MGKDEETEELVNFLKVSKLLKKTEIVIQGFTSDF